MPPRTTREPVPAAAALATRLVTRIGAAVLEERRRRSLTTRQVAERARISPASLNAVEAVRLTRLGYRVAIDHPYQHYQFAGRADVLAWSERDRALLHIENRTRFPNIGEAAGSFNAKCQYLAPVLARQMGLAPFVSQAHVVVALWSAEVLHVLRLRGATFRALCPDTDASLHAWLSGEPPARGITRSLVLLDPFASGKQRAILDLESALGRTKPRMRGYADAASRLGGA